MDDQTTASPDAPLVLLAGGGSGGHVFPALAVGDVLAERGWRVTFFGSRRGMEGGLVERHKVPFRGFPAQPWVGRGAVGKVWALGLAALSGVAAALAVRRLRPAVALATGGYAAVPGVIGAWLARVPVAILEPNATAGAANRQLSRLARVAFVAFPETAAGLRCRSVVAGVPVRRELFDLPTPGEGPLRLLVLGGSQGAAELNRLLPEALPLLGERRLSVLHQAGLGRDEAVRAAYRSAAVGGVEAEVVAFVDDVAGALARCHLVVCRAGAITLAELAAAGRGALLLPISLAGGHQAANAEAFAAAGAAEVLPAGARDASALASRLGSLVDDRERCLEMATAARRLARPEAAERIADHLAELGRAA